MKFVIISFVVAIVLVGSIFVAYDLKSRIISGMSIMDLFAQFEMLKDSVATEPLLSYEIRVLEEQISEWKMAVGLYVVIAVAASFVSTGIFFKSDSLMKKIFKKR